MKSLITCSVLFIIALIFVGCGQAQGTVQVDVGSAPLANAYRVDLYARHPGLDLVDGETITTGSEVTLENVQQGDWALLIQAQNGDGTTIGYYQAKISVKPDEVTKVSAGAYRPGLPGDPLPETSSTLESFGPNGEALLTASYTPGQDSVPEASIDLELVNGEQDGEIDVQAVAARSGLLQNQSPQCGTCFITPSVVERSNAQVLAQQVRPQLGTVKTGEETDFFVATSFQTVTCRRLLDDSQTLHCLIFAEVVDGNPVLSDSEALAIAQGFDGDNPFQTGDRGIYEDTRTRFGSEWKALGGRDGDERIAFVFLSPASIGGEGLFGFFYPTDEKSKDDSPSSNEGEILYINVTRAKSDLYDVLSTISHEFTHLILFNQKVARDGSFPEDAQPENAVLDEGLAVLNEELSGFGYTGEAGGNSFLLSSVSDLLKQGLNRRYFVFEGRLGDYGAGYLLWRFVHDQAGISKITQMTTSPQVGRDNIAAILEEPFEKIFQRFTQALASNDSSNLAPELRFTNLNLFSTYTSRDNKSFELTGLSEIQAVSLPGKLTRTTPIKAWGTIVYKASGGDGSPLSWKATGVATLVTAALSLTE